MKRGILLLLLGILVLAGTAVAGEKEDGPSRPTHTFLGVPTHPYTAITLSRPSGPDDWSTGFEAGVEFDIEPIWIGIEYTLHDILDETEVYEWDGTFSLKAGLYW